jgi:hypothetical protein
VAKKTGSPRASFTQPLAVDRSAFHSGSVPGKNSAGKHAHATHAHQSHGHFVAYVLHIGTPFKNCGHIIAYIFQPVNRIFEIFLKNYELFMIFCSRMKKYSFYSVCIACFVNKFPFFCVFLQKGIAIVKKV